MAYPRPADADRPADASRHQVHEADQEHAVDRPRRCLGYRFGDVRDVLDENAAEQAMRAIIDEATNAVVEDFSTQSQPSRSP